MLPCLLFTHQVLDHTHLETNNKQTSIKALLISRLRLENSWLLTLSFRVLNLWITNGQPLTTNSLLLVFLTRLEKSLTIEHSFSMREEKSLWSPWFSIRLYLCSISDQALNFVLLWQGWGRVLRGLAFLVSPALVFLWQVINNNQSPMRGIIIINNNKQSSATIIDKKHLIPRACSQGPSVHITKSKESRCHEQTLVFFLEKYMLFPL